MKIPLLAAVFFLYLLSGGCQHPAGEIITVEAPANDTVTYQAAPGNASCFTGFDARVINMPSGPLNSDGLVTEGPFTGNTDDTPYTIASTLNAPTACFGSSPVVACGAVITLKCNPVPSGAAQGTVTVSGEDDVICFHSTTDIQSGPCTNNNGKTIYNTGTVPVTFNGQTVSARYGQTSTSVGLATQLALALDANSVLSGEFISAANGPVAIIHALNTGTQYDYSWTSSCTYQRVYFHACSFTAGLSPAGSLASQ